MSDYRTLPSTRITHLCPFFVNNTVKLYCRAISSLVFMSVYWFGCPNSHNFFPPQLLQICLFANIGWTWYKAKMGLVVHSYHYTRSIFIFILRKTFQGFLIIVTPFSDKVDNIENFWPPLKPIIK